jgi:pyruvate-formate lyase
MAARERVWQEFIPLAQGDFIVYISDSTRKAVEKVWQMSSEVFGTECDALTFHQRIDALRETKLEQTREKQDVVGSMDHDDWALILPPEDRRAVVQTISGSGMPITDVLIEGVEMRTNHESGGFFGPEICGANFRTLLEKHPPYVDPMSSLAGGYMANFSSYRKVGWNPDIKPPEALQELRHRYKLVGGIGSSQHFCQDLGIGLELGWGGILDKIEHYRTLNTASAAFYNGLNHVARGMQAWIGNTVAEALRLAGIEEDAKLSRNLEEMADINERLVIAPPKTFREACQWILWYDMAARMYNGSGSLGRLDVLLTPYYEREKADATLSDGEAMFHIACLLVRDTAYLQIGGPDGSGRDVTNPVSFLILEASRLLRIPVNLGVCVGDGTDPRLLRRSVEIMVENKQGVPKFLGIDRTTEGFVKNGVPLEVARTRAYSGCHWSAIPGREYTLNDCVKVSFGPAFDIALREMLADVGVEPNMEELWSRFEKHLGIAVDGTKESLDFHLSNMPGVFPELVLDLLCHGPIEKGLDASDGDNGGVAFYNLGIDACALATIADSFAAIEQRVVEEKRLTWNELLGLLDNDWAGDDGELARVMMNNIDRYGFGGTKADMYARRISELFTRRVKENPTPNGFNCIPGIFSWANTIPLGKSLGATPNGRHAGAPISHGSNPDPGFRTDGAPSALAMAIASVQPGYGNTAPMQIEMDPGAVRGEKDVENVAHLIKTHFDLGGTQINMNIMDREKVLEAHEDPSKYPDLVVRVTGFSAYFASLSKEFRQLVVDRIIAE